MTIKFEKSLFEPIGIVVIGKDEGKRLKCCLQSLLNFVDHTVYVDSQSSDDSVKLASSMGFHVIVLDDSKPISRPRARNEGYALLKQLYPEMEFIHFLDGDTTLVGGWLDAAQKKFNEEPKVAIVCGLLKEKDRDKSIYRKICDIEWYREAGEVYKTGGIATIRINSLEVSGLYNEGIRGEDYELCRRFSKDGWKIFCLGETMGVHDSGMDTFKEYWLRGVKSGCGYVNGRSTGQFSAHRRNVWEWAVLPVIAMLLAIVNPLIGASVLLIYPVKIVQIAYGNSHKTASACDAMIYALHCVFVKNIELYGMLKCYFSRQNILSD